ncbi:MAG TPA: arylsulfatase [Niabella sp.]|nr:arylsulfatase [Niabella sp.]HRO83601.1 arylsulfatase [Niabella sp.]HUN03644.1 arylsulfatase [Niabella sp.]
MKHTKFILVMMATLFVQINFGQNTSRPNVIIILSDDQGYGDFSFNGNPIVQTKALDQLASEGLRFTNFHVSPFCTPTRGQLLSGMDALHNQAATVGAGRNTMRRDIVTMPEIFRQNGYTTGIFGKWHLGDNYPDRPMDRGFDKCIWFKGWGLLSESEYDNDYYNTRYLNGLSPAQSGKYCTDLWFDEAIKWMDEVAGGNSPFFTYIATNAPHGPFHAPLEDYLFYRDKTKDSAVAGFFGMLKSIDRNVAALEKWLEEKKLKDNTILIYMNDNGGTGGVDVYNAGMRGKKGELYDGGHRAVCFFRWPAGRLDAPRNISTASEIQDLLPTFIDLLDFELVNLCPPYDGVSLVPVLKQTGTIKDRMFVVQYAGKAKPEKYDGCVVWNNWRLVGSNDLYDIKTDSGQQYNIAREYPAVFDKMLSFYEDWWSGCEEDINHFVPVVVGSIYQKSVILTSDFWENGDYINTQWKVAQALGPSIGGTWHIQVEHNGWYRAELSRWPFHLKRSLVAMGVDAAVGGSRLRKGKGLPIQSGFVSVNGNSPVMSNKSGPEAIKIDLQIKLSKKDTTLRAWFKDVNGNDLCGSYYLRLTPIK